MTEEKILTKHPLGKSGKNINKQSYETLKKAILSTLRKKELTHTELFNQLNQSLIRSPHRMARIYTELGDKDEVWREKAKRRKGCCKAQQPHDFFPDQPTLRPAARGSAIYRSAPPRGSYKLAFSSGRLALIRAYLRRSVADDFFIFYNDSEAIAFHVGKT